MDEIDLYIGWLFKLYRTRVRCTKGRIIKFYRNYSCRLHEECINHMPMSSVMLIIK